MNLGDACLNCLNYLGYLVYLSYRSQGTRRSARSAWVIQRPKTSSGTPVGLSLIHISEPTRPY